MSTVSVANACPRKNVCDVTSAEALPCGYASDHLSPNFIAEQLCVNALRGYLFMAEGGGVDRRSDYGDVARLQQASAHLELALSPDVDQIESATQFRLADSLFNVIKTTDFLSMQDAVMTRTLQAYLPAFRLRYHGTRPGADVYSSVNYSLTNLSRMIQTAPLHRDNLPPEHRGDPGHRLCVGSEDERIKLRRKLTVQMLLLEGGLECYPASYRERYPCDDSQKPLTHDMYILRDRSKFPFRLGNAARRGSSAGPAVISYKDVIGSAASNVELSYDTLRKMAPGLIERKAAGEYLASREVAYVGALAQAAVAQVVEHYN